MIATASECHHRKVKKKNKKTKGSKGKKERKSIIKFLLNILFINPLGARAHEESRRHCFHG